MDDGVHFTGETTLLYPAGSGVAQVTHSNHDDDGDDDDDNNNNYDDDDDDAAISGWLRSGACNATWRYPCEIAKGCPEYI